MQNVKGKKKRKVNPTTKQKKAAKLMAENLASEKPKSKGAILKEAGYSDVIADNPNRVVSTNGFQAALTEYLPDDFLLKNHNELIEQRDYMPSAVKALELAYDIKGMRSDKGGMGFSQFLAVINVNSQPGSEVPEQVIDVTEKHTETHTKS